MFRVFSKSLTENKLFYDKLNINKLSNNQTYLYMDNWQDKL